MPQEKSRQAHNFFTKQITFAVGVLLASTVVVPLSAHEIGPLKAHQRSHEAYRVRHEAALRNFHAPLPAHPDNHDERRYSDRMNSYTKGLPHDANGIVLPNAYKLFYHALSTGRNADFEAIPLGTPGGSRLRNPQSA